MLLVPHSAERGIRPGWGGGMMQLTPTGTLVVFFRESGVLHGREVLPPSCHALKVFFEATL